MTSCFETTDDRRDAARAAAALLASAIAHGMPCTAPIAAKMAARSTLLALAGWPARRSGPEWALLRDVAAAPPGGPAALTAEGASRLHATLDAVERLLASATSHHMEKKKEG